MSGAGYDVINFISNLRDLSTRGMCTIDCAHLPWIHVTMIDWEKLSDQAMERFSIDSCVRGYHDIIWDASVSEELPDYLAAIIGL